MRKTTQIAPPLSSYTSVHLVERQTCRMQIIFTKKNRLTVQLIVKINIEPTDHCILSCHVQQVEKEYWLMQMIFTYKKIVEQFL